MVVILQCIHISNHYVVQLKLIQCSMSIISQIFKDYPAVLKTFHNGGGRCGCFYNCMFMYMYVFVSESVLF